MKSAAVFLLGLLVCHCSALGLFESQLEHLLSEDSNFCTERQDGNYADSSNCNLYITCSNGFTIANRHCPTGLAFNEAIGMCDYPSNVPGCSGSSGSGFCHEKSDGNYKDSGNCHGFIMCSNGHTYHMTCPGQTNFDPAKKRCEDYDCSGRDVAYLTDQNDGGFCAERSDGDYQDPDACEGFISCSNHITYHMPCPENLRFNPTTKHCDNPENVQCGPTRPPTPKVPPTTKAPFTKSPFCVGKQNGKYADANNCNGFVMCSNGYIYYMDCPSNLRYDPAKGRCEWADTVDCGQRPTISPHPPKPTTMPPQPTPPKSPFCEEKKNGDYADPSNCNGFITCSNGYAYKRDCPFNLKFDTKKLECEWPNKVNCKSRPTTVPYVTKPTPPSGNSEFCKKNGNGRYRDPHNCLGYIVCRGGNIYFRNCRRGLRFNGVTKRCDLPRNVKCAGAGGGTFCEGRKDGDYVDAVNCNGFIKCSNQLTYYFDCPSNLRFNIKKDWCDWPENVWCPYL
ncbi:chondroitin proteoglycan 2 isoform X2 [Nematostella vectensis]|uniref:chondroitin proteoglycan 2 isoform X2 n=1 Tax=Nematostella vectensis TaxID=45351 RepID=UPI00139066D3|nr:chondroitin proteoglycan 2 isoform X2 [Nematostella vectensis]